VLPEPCVCAMCERHGPSRSPYGSSLIESAQYPEGSGFSGNAGESMLLEQAIFQCDGVNLSTIALNAAYHSVSM
jgi:hypothetical protein